MTAYHNCHWVSNYWQTVVETRHGASLLYSLHNKKNGMNRFDSLESFCHTTIKLSPVFA
ncbi:hypothetical protein MC7420_2652 [Coleofasciculus chthonoplastes PCC 7420]|uniref:Uncharacterized protein n=1 Tax=Coleofasciculus chthonoplastes PCC 7420 TaxID=118168 RepID=B4VYI9_9CYAN|nr:hypothetical protein MC7420_2652 [Coleofasciculus chthonoplastes PCC 7420]